MADYMFRGNPITAVEAYVLLDSVQRVLDFAPNPTTEDAYALEMIIKDFEESVELLWQEELQDHEENSLEGLDRDK